MSDAWLDGLTTLCRDKSDYAKTGDHWSIFLSPGDILDAAKRLYAAEFFLEDVSVADTADGFMVVYHFDHFQRPGRVTLRVMAPKAKPEVPSISSVFQGADWHERESHDFYGVVFTGHPNLIPLLLDPEEDIHPLVKKDKDLKPVGELLAANNIVDCDPTFELLAAKEKEEAQEGEEAAEGEEGEE